MPQSETADVGIDIGKRRIALGWPYWKVSRAIDLVKPGERGQELRALTDWLCRQLPDGARLWIEMPYLSNGPGANQSTTIGMAETVGAIKAAAPWAEISEVGQSTWKAKVCGNGRATKNEVAAWLADNHPSLYEATGGLEDQVDAMCIGLYGMFRTLGQIPPPEPKRSKRRKAGP